MSRIHLTFRDYSRPYELISNVVFECLYRYRCRGEQVKLQLLQRRLLSINNKQIPPVLIHTHSEEETVLEAEAAFVQVMDNCKDIDGHTCVQFSGDHMT